LMRLTIIMQERRLQGLVWY